MPCCYYFPIVRYKETCSKHFYEAFSAIEHTYNECNLCKIYHYYII